EAYIKFAGDAESCLDLVDRQDNVVILRTLSKLGLAGLRVGMLIGRAELVQEVEKVRPPYNVGVLPQLAATMVLGRHAALLEAGVAQVVAERERVAAALEAAGATVFPSKANFILVRLPEATRVWEQLLGQGVLVKNFDRPGTPLEACLRITIGTP